MSNTKYSPFDSTPAIQSISGINVKTKSRFPGEKTWYSPEDFENERSRRINIKNRKKKILKLLDDEK